MDYESRQVKWYWLFLFIGYSAMACYILFTGNPYLYSQNELRSALTEGSNETLDTIPSEPVVTGKPGSVTYFARQNFARTGVDPTPGTRGKGYEEFEKHEVVSGVERWEPQHIAADRTGFYTTSTSGWVVAVGLDGKSRWRFRFLRSPGEKGFLPPLVDETQVYVVHPQGETIAFDKMTGEIRWLLPLKAELVAHPFIWGNHIVLPTKGAQGVQLALVARTNGEKLDSNPRLDVKPGFMVSYASEADHLIATADNKVYAIDPENWAVAWTATLTEPIRGPASIIDGDIFVVTLGAKLLKLNGERKGKIDWDIQLEKPAAAPPTAMPIMGRLAFVDTSGALMTVETKTGKVYWRYGIDAKETLPDVWAARLSAKYIEENKMDWLHKGWTIWSSCGDRRVCFYTPLKGALINRLQLPGTPLTPPLLMEKRIVFFTKAGEGKFILSHQVEDGEVKRIRKEAAEKAQASSGG